MSVKGWAAAHRYKGGVIKYIYDKVKALDTSSGAIKEAIGKAEGTGAGGILKDVKDCKDAIGADDTASGSLKKRCKDIETTIGDASDPAEGTILARIAALENK